MKICLSARQDPQYLDRADEIIFEFRDRKAIPNYIIKYPNKTIILSCSLINDIDWDELKAFNEQASGNFLLEIQDLVLIPICQQYNLKFYLTYAITSYDELNTIINLDSYYVRLGPPLFFDLDNIKTRYPDLKIRMAPNIAYDDKYKRKHGLYGTWVRPEDIQMYNEYIDVIEFKELNPQRERALYRIYIEEREWPGELNMIITNFNHEGENAFITSDITERRLTCRQVCQSHGICSICLRAMSIANREKLQEYKDAITPKYQIIKEEN